ncbi:serine acetyltransferase [Microbacterium sp. SORGH_AS 862]|nr:serine acetyltransferase [Microbacterium sp. SORGH_AS_0862]MDQ1206223.1 serine acetyltransferase [Microbacterium sp. SORGH_AS_0862]
MCELRDTLREDFRVNARGLDRATVLVFRLNQAAHRGCLVAVKRPLAKILDLLWTQLTIGAELPGTVKCGPGLRLPHAGRGVIINANSTIGRDVTIYHRVTLGVSGADPRNVPTILDGAYLGTGASVIGGVTVGADAKVGAGAVVTKDVPDGALAVGVPAHVREA